jgi:hypothetical protein
VERKKSVVEMETDIAFLLQEVKELRKMIITKESGGGNGSGASDMVKQNMDASPGANSAPWDSPSMLGMQTADRSIKDRQIVDAVLSNK